MTRRPRAPQAHASLGRAIHHRQDFEAQNIQASQQSRRGLQQRLEHPTATSLLPLRCFQVIHTPRLHTPTKSNHQGRVNLASVKPDPPSGARRGEPPLRQNFPWKKSFCSSNSDGPRTDTVVGRLSFASPLKGREPDIKAKEPEVGPRVALMGLSAEKLSLAATTSAPTVASTNTAPASAGRPKAHRQVLTPVLATKARTEDGMLHPGWAAIVRLPRHGWRAPPPQSWRMVSTLRSWKKRWPADPCGR
jgi:hypothetical protein